MYMFRNASYYDILIEFWCNSKEELFDRMSIQNIRKVFFATL